MNLQSFGERKESSLTCNESMAPGAYWWSAGKYISQECTDCVTVHSTFFLSGHYCGLNAFCIPPKIHLL